VQPRVGRRYARVTIHGVPDERNAASACSAVETGVLVFFDQGQKGFDSTDFWLRGILVPFEISALPIEQPPLAGLQVPRLRDRFLDLLRVVVPARSDFEELDTLIGETEAQINLVANVSRRAMLCDVLSDSVLDALSLDIIQCHRLA